MVSEQAAMMILLNQTRTHIFRYSILIGFLLVLVLIPLVNLSKAEAQIEACDPMGWFPTEFGLKDHHVFAYGYYYLVSNKIPGENYFAYARSTDFCTWEDMTPVLEHRENEWENLAVWAPFVYEEGGTYYMYYTGVKAPYPLLTQSIMLATSTNPADPASWQLQGMIFQPNHPGMVWQDGEWADCRDPMMMKVDDTYHLYYTGRDEDGGIIGLATASSPEGPWEDQGSILTIAEDPIPESATLFSYDGFYYIFYNRRGEFYRVGASSTGPWSEEARLVPGWAHEVWTGLDAQIHTSYLTDYTVTISPLSWDDYFVPARPFIGTEIYHFMIPVVKR
jgi:hypothetical protein